MDGRGCKVLLFIHPFFKISRQTLNFGRAFFFLVKQSLALQVLLLKLFYKFYLFSQSLSNLFQFLHSWEHLYTENSNFMVYLKLLQSIKKSLYGYERYCKVFWCLSAHCLVLITLNFTVLVHCRIVYWGMHKQNTTVPHSARSTFPSILPFLLSKH